MIETGSKVKTGLKAPFYEPADSADPNNSQEWHAGKAPTNALSWLILLVPATAPSGLGITWQSVLTRR